MWSVDAGYAAEASVAATAEYGTRQGQRHLALRPGPQHEIAEIYDMIHNGDREERVVNQEETLAAREKQKLIKERFRAWVFTDARAHGTLGANLQRHLQ